MLRLILFDIDGTLLWSNGAGGLAMHRALVEVYGGSGILANMSLAGMTDRSIIHTALTESGFSPQEVQVRWGSFSDALTRHMLCTVQERPVQPCPGVLCLLDTLAARDDVVLGLETGNLASTASIKLQAAGIDPHLFRVGGFGSDDGDRNRLPSIAAQRAESLFGQRFRGQCIVVVGDTPADVACGKAVGARTVAVATGIPTSAELMKSNPDVLLPHFADLDVAVAALLG
jgi:phosphoglycolate phosphatase